jgi:hypothetical protein
MGQWSQEGAKFPPDELLHLLDLVAGYAGILRHINRPIAL